MEQAKKWQEMLADLKAERAAIMLEHTTKLVEPTDQGDRLCSLFNDESVNTFFPPVRKHKVKARNAVRGQAAELFQQIMGKIIHREYDYHQLAEIVNATRRADRLCLDDIMVGMLIPVRVAAKMAFDAVEPAYIELSSQLGAETRAREIAVLNQYLTDCPEICHILKTMVSAGPHTYLSAESIAKRSGLDVTEDMLAGINRDMMEIMDGSSIGFPAIESWKMCKEGVDMNDEVARKNPANFIKKYHVSGFYAETVKEFNSPQAPRETPPAPV